MPSLNDYLKTRIEAGGPMPVAEFMALALTHPEFGYYMRRDPLGAEGDFTTSPEICQIFGEMVGLWLAKQWLNMGSPSPVTLAELGPGRGTLMKDMLRATQRLPKFHDALSVCLVEASPVLRQKQWQTLAGAHPRIEWLESIETLPAAPLLLAANEFFDALPITQYVEEEGKRVERRIRLNGDTLEFTAPDEAVVEERCIPAEAIIAQLARHLQQYGGACLIIDYGYTQASSRDTLQAVKAHQQHPVLSDPGEADLTAHVNFSALAQTAAANGASVTGPIEQGRWLLNMGATHRAVALAERATDEQRAALLSGLDRIASPEQMGALFKVLALTSPNLQKPEGF